MGQLVSGTGEAMAMGQDGLPETYLDADSRKKTTRKLGQLLTYSITQNSLQSNAAQVVLLHAKHKVIVGERLIDHRHYGRCVAIAFHQKIAQTLIERWRSGKCCTTGWSGCRWDRRRSSARRVELHQRIAGVGQFPVRLLRRRLRTSEVVVCIHLSVVCVRCHVAGGAIIIVEIVCSRRLRWHRGCLRVVHGALRHIANVTTVPDPQYYTFDHASSQIMIFTNAHPCDILRSYTTPAACA